MIPQRKPFELPMSFTLGVCRDGKTGKVSAHALDFDLVCVADDEAEAIRKIQVAVKSYVEFGLSNDWAEDILFPAPAEYWEQLRGSQITVMQEPILIMARRMLVYRATPCHEAHESRRVAVPA
jgi:hypothetical protein